MYCHVVNLDFFLPGGSKGKIYNDKWQYDSTSLRHSLECFINRKYFPVTLTILSLTQNRKKIFKIWNKSVPFSIFIFH